MEKFSFPDTKTAKNAESEQQVAVGANLFLLIPGLSESQPDSKAPNQSRNRQVILTFYEGRRHNIFPQNEVSTCFLSVALEKHVGRHGVGVSAKLRSSATSISLTVSAAYTAVLVVFEIFRLRGRRRRRPPRRPLCKNKGCGFALPPRNLSRYCTPVGFFSPCTSGRNAVQDVSISSYSGRHILQPIAHCTGRCFLSLSRSEDASFESKAKDSGAKQ